MKTTLLVVLASSLLRFALHAQPTVPQQITSGPGDDTHPSFVNLEYAIGNTCYLALTRTTTKGSNICVLTCQNLEWLDTVDVVTDDSAGNDFATLSNGGSPDNPETMLLWQRGKDTTKIWYSIRGSTGWSTPMRVTADIGEERSPWVLSHDSAFGAVWERNGRILYADFVNGAWTAPVFVTPPGDTGNSCPVASYNNMLAIWEKEKPDTNAHSLMYAYRWNGAWSTPETLAYAGDNRRPRFVRPAAMFGGGMVSYESNVTGDWEIYGISANVYGGSGIWDRPATNVSANPTADDRHASFMTHAILLEPENSIQGFGFLVGAWAVQAGTSDSILIAEFLGTHSDMLTVAPGTTDRDPEISDGTDSGPFVRVWTVWENNSTGAWKLYAAYRDVMVGLVPEDRIARSFHLYQNYPNPFNPTTTVRYQLTEVSLVTLAVTDILGRQVATLVNQIQQPGMHAVQFDGARLASGVYFSHLHATPLTHGTADHTHDAVRKLILLR